MKRSEKEKVFEKHFHSKGAHVKMTAIMTRIMISE
jgi:hypothetical protein